MCTVDNETKKNLLSDTKQHNATRNSLQMVKKSLIFCTIIQCCVSGSVRENVQRTTTKEEAGIDVVVSNADSKADVSSTSARQRYHRQRLGSIKIPSRQIKKMQL